MMNPLLSVPESQLPPPYDAVLDPALPLPPGVRLLQQSLAAPVGLAWILVFLFGALGAVGLVFYVAELLRGPLERRQLLTAPLVLLLLGGLIVGPLLNLRAQLGRRAQLAGGGHRYGLFLFPDALLLRFQGSPVTLVPRASVRELQHRDMKSSVGHIVLTCTGEGGQPVYVYITSELPVPLASLLRTLRRWQESGATNG